MLAIIKTFGQLNEMIIFVFKNEHCSMENRRKRAKQKAERAGMEQRLDEGWREPAVGLREGDRSERS